MNVIGLNSNLFIKKKGKKKGKIMSIILTIMRYKIKKISLTA